MIPLTWMPAKAFGGKLSPSVVVVHCTESDNGPGTAESLAGPNWFGGSKAGTSAHKMFDRDSGVEMVRRTVVAFAAGPRGNTVGVHYEFCGRASWSHAKWREPEQLTALKLAAPHMADDLRAMGSPARWLSLAQLAGKARGMCTHNDIRLALGGTTHSDPGPNFPYAELLSYVQAALAGTPALPVPEDDMPLTDADVRKIMDWPFKTLPGGRVLSFGQYLDALGGAIDVTKGAVDGVPGRVWAEPVPRPNADPMPAGALLGWADRAASIAATAGANPAAVAAELLPGLIAHLPAAAQPDQLALESALRGALRSLA